MKLHKLTCPHCSGIMDMEIKEDATFVFCPYCGQKFLVDDEKQEYTINKNININKTTHERYTNDADIIRAEAEADVIRAKKETDETHNLLKVSFTLLLLPIIIPIIIVALVLGGLFVNKTINQSQGKISAGYYRKLIGEDYQTIEAHFEAAGFTNIELIDLNDAGIGFWNEGKVATISIGGDSNFYSFNYFTPDTKVVISYH